MTRLVPSQDALFQAFPEVCTPEEVTRRGAQCGAEAPPEAGRVLFPARIEPSPPPRNYLRWSRWRFPSCWPAGTCLSLLGPRREGGAHQPTPSPASRSSCALGGEAGALARRPAALFPCPDSFAVILA